jgi:hypothetical protein
VATGGIGALGYALGTDVAVFDRLGLSDPITARFRIDARSSHPGHEKPIPAVWASARLSTDGHVLPASALPPIPFLPLLTPATDGARFTAGVAAARAALRCGAVRTLERDVHQPLTVSRFFGNVADSFGNTRLRIDPDPQRARRRLCH